MPVTKEVEQIEWSLEQIAKGGYDHFMLKEIFEQPRGAAQLTSRGRLDLRERRIKLGGLAEHGARAGQDASGSSSPRCGTAWHAGLVGEYLFEDLARIPTEVEYASEFRYRNPIIEDGTVVIAISQSGETADTLAALREAKREGRAGPGHRQRGRLDHRPRDRRGRLPARRAGDRRGLAPRPSPARWPCEALIALYAGPAAVHVRTSACEQYMDALDDDPRPDRAGAGAVRRRSRHVAEQYVDRDNWLFLGRGYNYPVALEGALKLKEISYIHAEGLPAAEMKHGPIALIHEGMPVVVVAPRCATYDKIISNIEEVRARGGQIIAVATEGDERDRAATPST